MEDENKEQPSIKPEFQGLIEGRVVHFCFLDGDTLKHRPAIVVKVWNKSEGYVNLQVFPDGSNDKKENIVWETSVNYSASPKDRTWHWFGNQAEAIQECK